MVDLSHYLDLGISIFSFYPSDKHDLILPGRRDPKAQRNQISYLEQKQKLAGGEVRILKVLLDHSLPVLAGLILSFIK